MSDGYGQINAGLFVEEAERFNMVKPQAWFDSPAVYLPNDAEQRRQDDQPAAEPTASPSPTAEPPAPMPMGSLITEDGVKSTYEVTQAMLDSSNFERLEHVTVRVWIDHQRRGDVEVELTSPNGIKSVLARSRRFDTDVNGFPGWKFMSLKHW